MTKNIWGSDGWSGGYVPQPRERVLAVLPDGHEIEAEYRYPTARYTQWVPSFYSDEQIEADLSVPRPSLLEDATHICEHGNIHCQCPVTLWIEAQDRLARCVPSLLARAQQADAEAVERLRQFNAAKDQRDAALAEADRLRAELAEAKAENEALRQVAQSDRETAKDYADEIAAAHAERDRLAAQVAAVRSLFDGGPDTSCRTVWQNGIECVTVPLRDLRAALDGTEQDEAKAPIRATCSGGGPSTEPGMALIEFRVPQGTERRLGAEWLLTPVSRPTEGDEQ